MKKTTLFLLFFIILKFVLQYSLVSPEYELHRDEFLHLDQGKHLAWGYLSVPPFTAWTAWIIGMMGNGIFWVKFFPALFGALTLIVVWKIIAEFNGGWFALTIGAVSVLLSSLLRLNMLFQPNSADIFFWTFLYFGLLKYFRTNNNKWLYITAIAFAFGLLNKYNILFLTAGIFPALLLQKSRKIFATKHLYFAFAIAFIMVLPNVIWQYQNHFPVAHHMKLLAKTQLVNVNRIDFLKEQLLFFIGSLFVLIAAFVSFFIYRPFREYRFFFWSFLITLTLFTYCKAKGYYAIGLYPVFLGFGAVWLEHLLSGRRKIILKIIAIAIPVLLFIPISRVAFPNISPSEITQNKERYQKFGLLRWEDGKDHELPQDFADMQGWKELAEKTDKAYLKINDPEHTIVICDNYGQAGAINYYSKIPNINAVSMNADYVDWFDLNRKIKHAILVKDSNDEDKNRTDETPLFGSVYKSGEITNPFAREKGTSIYILQNATADINSRISEEIREVKQEVSQ
jgi:dolichyl-phosphate-mannose-protein mannosyltransferase